MGGTTSKESPPGGSENRGGVQHVTTNTPAAESDLGKQDSTSTSVLIDLVTRQAWSMWHRHGEHDGHDDEHGDCQIWGRLVQVRRLIEFRASGLGAEPEPAARAIGPPRNRDPPRRSRAGAGEGQQWCKAIVVCRVSEITSQVKSSQVKSEVGLAPLGG